MPYTPTGKPPGRPRKDGLPAGSKPESEPVAPVDKVMRPGFDAFARPLRPESEDICPQCFPALVGTHPRNVISCKHGIYYGG